MDLWRKQNAVDGTQRDFLLSVLATENALGSKYNKTLLFIYQTQWSCKKKSTEWDTQSHSADAKEGEHKLGVPSMVHDYFYT